MADDPLERRVRDNEKDIAVLKQQVSDQRSQIERIAPVVVGHSNLETLLQGQQKAIDTIRTDIDDLERENLARDRREHDRQEEHRRFRVTSYLSFAGLALMFFGLIVAILTFVVGHG